MGEELTAKVFDVVAADVDVFVLTVALLMTLLIPATVVEVEGAFPLIFGLGVVVNVAVLFWF